MRILYLCPDHGVSVFGRRGCSTHVREACSKLSELGHEVVLLCSLRGDEDIAPQDFEIVEVPPVRSKYLGYDGRYLWHNIPYYRTAARWIRQRGFDGIYERLSLYPIAGARLSRLFRIPRLLEINAFLTEEHRKKIHFPALARRYERQSALAADQCLVVSSPLREQLLTWNCNPDKIALLPTAVDEIRFRPDTDARQRTREEWGATDRFVVGYVGGLAAWHGITHLYDIARTLRERLPRAIVIVVGGDPVRLDEHRNRVREEGLDNALRFVGSVPYERVPACINAMDAALVPDTLPWTCPTKMFEYQACGVPVIAPALPGVESCMDHGREGYLFPAGDFSSIVPHIERLNENPKLCRSMGERARERVCQTHTWRHNAEHIVERFERQRMR
jgi:glycosyltransferase involved in cell wall biosynthesis